MVTEAQMNLAWLDAMSDDAKGGNFVHFEKDEEKFLLLKSEPHREESNFKNRDGSAKVQWTFEVCEGKAADKIDTKTILMWSVSSKALLGQIVGITRINHLQNLNGCILRVIGMAEGQNRKWFCTLVGVHKAAQAPQPPADPGITWLEEQKAGAQ